jgi:hypothetical protein
MTYKPFSQTTSGWSISVDEDAPPDKRWRAVHPVFGERFFPTHDEILEYTVKNMLDQFRRIFKT